MNTNESSWCSVARPLLGRPIGEHQTPCHHLMLIAARRGVGPGPALILYQPHASPSISPLSVTSHPSSAHLSCAARPSAHAGDGTDDGWAGKRKNWDRNRLLGKVLHYCALVAVRSRNMVSEDDGGVERAKEKA
ncbi:uncharacterized [Tachysurus ichikawai]